MRCLLFIICLFIVLPVTSTAALTLEVSMVNIPPKSEEPMDWSSFDTSAAAYNEELRIAEENGWCRQAAPNPKPGEVYIHYSRNAAGQCVGNLIVGEKQ